MMEILTDKIIKAKEEFAIKNSCGDDPYVVGYIDGLKDGAENYKIKTTKKISKFPEIKGYTIEKAGLKIEPIKTYDYLVYDKRGAELMFNQGFDHVYCLNEEDNKIVLCNNIQEVEEFYKT